MHYYQNELIPFIINIPSLKLANSCKIVVATKYVGLLFRTCIYNSGHEHFSNERVDFHENVAQSDLRNENDMHNNAHGPDNSAKAREIFMPESQFYSLLQVSV